MMNIDNIESLKMRGFSGFIKISELKIDSSFIPKLKGVYLILRPENSRVEIIEIGTGGFFKGKNPNVLIKELQRSWIEESKIIYIGKAGGTNSNATLQSRLIQYLNFGKGKNIGHWGGRYIWQIKDIDDYLICWKVLPEEDPRSFEIKLLETFKQKYNVLPFANLTD
jgi:hypothetical protein